MAQYTVSFSVALTAATAKTVVRWMTPASRSGKLVTLSATDKLAGSTDQGIGYRILTGGTDGTGTSQTPYPLNDAKACVATAKVNYTAEPTGSPTEVLRGAIPAGGGIAEAWEGIVVPHSSAIAIEFTAAQARGAGVVEGFATFEE